MMDEGAGRFAYDGLERAFHERARLGILTSLMSHPRGLVFSELKELCSLTDGNLNRHLKVLVDESVVEIEKQPGGRGSRGTTVCRLTELGRTRLLDYLQVLESVIADARNAAETQATQGHRTEPGYSAT